MRFLTSGKVKDLYEVDDQTILFRFSDRVSAYDVKFREEIPKKGEVLCKFAEYWFGKIPVPNHFIKRISETEILVKKMKMLPIECVVRGYFYGSLADRHEKGQIKLPGFDPILATKLPEPVFDPTTKSAHDLPTDRQQSVQTGLVTEKEFDWLQNKSIYIYNAMARIADDAGFILADLKLEFGRTDDGILLGDSIGPDEYRLWLKDEYAEGQTQEAYDKQILRDWLAIQGYQARFEKFRQEGKEPVAPPIPRQIIEKMTARYVAAYERITGRTL